MLVIVLTIVTVLLIGWLWKKKKVDQMPAGPNGWPVFGNTFQIDPYKFHFTLEQWAKDFGPVFKCSILRTNMVVLSSPELIKLTGADTKGLW